jgi:hypothetical protein
MLTVLVLLPLVLAAPTAPHATVPIALLLAPIHIVTLLPRPVFHLLLELPHMFAIHLISALLLTANGVQPVHLALAAAIVLTQWTAIAI